MDAGRVAEFFEGEPRVIAEGFRFTEGPLWDAAQSRLIFSDIPASTIFAIVPPAAGEGAISKEKATVVRTPSSRANGNAFDAGGRLISACHDGVIERMEKDGSVTTLARAHEDRRLNSPNDLVVRSDGAIFFTDPTFGIRPQDRQIPFQGVWRIDTGGALSLVDDSMDLPNGLAFSPDESKLYVADFRRGEIIAFELAGDGSVANRYTFAELKGPGRGRPDGVKVDEQGNVYSTGPGGIWVFTPGGERVALLAVDGASNLAFGGSDRKTLFITAGPRVLMVRTKIAGR
jgi:gluconolactonase